VHDAARVVGHDADDRLGQVRRVRRTAALIVHDAQRVRALIDQTLDRFHEIQTVEAEEPRRAEDEVSRRMPRRGLAEQLRAPVRRLRIDRIVDLVGSALRAIEHVVGRDLHQQRAGFVCRGREQLHRRAVDRVRDARLRLGLIDLRVRRAVDDHVRPQLGHARGDAAGVGDVEIVFGERVDGLIAKRQRVAEVAADHAARAGDEPSRQGG